MTSGAAPRQQRSSELKSVTSPIQRTSCDLTSCSWSKSLSGRTSTCTITSSRATRFTKCEPKNPVAPVMSIAPLPVISVDHARIRDWQNELATALSEWFLLFHDLVGEVPCQKQ